MTTDYNDRMNAISERIRIAQEKRREAMEQPGITPPERKAAKKPYDEEILQARQDLGALLDEIRANSAANKSST